MSTRLFRTYLNDGGTSDDSIVSDSVVAVIQYNVRLAGKPGGDLHTEAAVDCRSLDVGRTCDRDERSVDARALKLVALVDVHELPVIKSGVFCDRAQILTGVSRVTVMPVATGDFVPAARTSGGKAFTGRGGLLLGQEVMNCDAKE